MNYYDDWGPLTQLRGELVAAIPPFQGLRDLDRADNPNLIELVTET